MSGGSYNYAYRTVSAFAAALKHAETPERRAFASLLEDVAEAMQAVEWVDSGDYSPGDENSHIEQCLNKEIVLEQVIAEAKAATDVLRAVMERLVPIESPEKALYYDLIYTVENAYPGESRHETARRYLQQAGHSGDAATSAQAQIKE